MQKRYWTAICPIRRTQAIGAITGIVDQYGAILNSTLFSDISLNLVIEVDPGKIQALHDALHAILRLEGDPPDDAPNGCLVLMSITFTDATGNLEIEVPMVPG